MSNKIKERKPLIAGALSFFFPGVGQIYNGQIVKGIIIVILGHLIAFSIPYFLIKVHPVAFFVVLFLILLLYWTANVVDSIISAKKCQDLYILKRYNRWYIYIIIILFFHIIPDSISESLHEKAYEFYEMSSSSMNPTLKIGDVIIVDKIIYKKRDPKRTDIIAFIFPRDETIVSFRRIVGLPHDTILIKGENIYINGSLLNEPYVFHATGLEGKLRKSFGPITVPEDSYFLLGDTRHGTHDSTYYGPIKRDKIIGKAKYIYFSRDKTTSSIHWKRIGIRLGAK